MGGHEDGPEGVEDAQVGSDGRRRAGAESGDEEDSRGFPEFLAGEFSDEM